MHPFAILHPVFALALWTGLVLVLIPIARARSILRRNMTMEDLKYGESSSVPASVGIPNRNYMNLLELPVLFYVACLVVYVTGAISPTMVGVAWSYVALRVVHSVIHLTYNNVVHRLAAFALSNVVLVILWVLAASKAFSGASA